METVWPEDHAVARSYRSYWMKGMCRKEYQRREGGPAIVADYKSRLCGRGDLEGIDGLRKDSPTAEIESHNLLFSWAASNKLILKTADISNAYFQSDPLDRLLQLKSLKVAYQMPTTQMARR